MGDLTEFVSELPARPGAAPTPCKSTLVRSDGAPVISREGDSHHVRVQVHDAWRHPLAGDVDALDILADVDLARLPGHALDESVLQQDVSALDDLCNRRCSDTSAVYNASSEPQMCLPPVPVQMVAFTSK